MAGQGAGMRANILVAHPVVVVHLHGLDICISVLVHLHVFVGGGGCALLA